MTDHTHNTKIQTKTTESKKEKVFTRDIILILAASFFYMASPMLVTPLITGFTESLGAGALIMGLVGGITNLVSLVCQPFSGNLADRVSKYSLGCIGSAFLVAACTGYVLAVNPAMVMFFRILNGLGFAFCSVCFSTWLANLLPPDKVGFGMGLYGMMNALAMAISPAIGVRVYHLLGYRQAFVVSVAAAAICFLLCQFCGDKGRPAPKKAAAKEKKEFRLVDRRVIPLALVIMCFACPYCATQSFIVRYTETRGLNITVSMFFTIYAAALLVSRLFLSNWFDKIPFKIFLAAGTFFEALSMLCLTFMKNNFLMFLAAVFMSGGYGIMCTVCQSNAVTRVEPEKRGLANGTYYIGMNCGMAFGPIIGGFLYGNVSIELFYPCLMILIPLCLVLYAVSSRICGEEGKS